MPRRAYAPAQAGGTLEHSAPETLPRRDAEGHMVKEACYAPPADIWSLGAILFHLLSGQPLINLDLEKTSSAGPQHGRSTPGVSLWEAWGKHGGKHGGKHV